MAVDDRRRRRDLFEVSLRPHDERVEVAGWTYYVRAVQRDSEFTGTGPLTTELFIDLPLLLLVVRRVRGRRRPWVVGVVRFVAAPGLHGDAGVAPAKSAVPGDCGPIGRSRQLREESQPPEGWRVRPGDPPNGRRKAWMSLGRAREAAASAGALVAARD